MTLAFGSLFAGIGGFDLGFAEMECAVQVEIDGACREILGRHWPGVKRLEDVRNATARDLGAIELVCGGFPCQDLSIAGRRKGLAGDRSGLWYEFHRLLAEARPQWVVIEQVPGLLSSNGGRDFATVLRGVVELGYGVCWRVLDAQHFGVAQRRRRVFVVGSLGDGRAASVLFEPEGVPGDSAAGPEAGEGVAASLRSRSHGPGISASGRGGEDDRKAVIACLNSGGNDGGFRTEPEDHIVTVQCQGSNVGEMGTLRAGNGGLTGGVPAVLAFDRTRSTVSGDVTAPLRVNSAASPGVNQGKADNQCVAFNWQSGGDVRLGISGRATSALHASQTPAVHAFGIRRLTPRECERLQGFPDDWTRWGADGRELSDSARYRMLGNAVAVPCTAWIGRRILDAAAGVP